MSVVQIISAGEEHLPAIGDLARLIWHECYPGIITREQIDYMLTRMYSVETLKAELRSGIHFERLLIDGGLAGFASFGPTEQIEAIKLHKLYLHPKRHGHGFGTGLLQHCENEARKLGALQLTLNVNKHNTKAIAMYQRNGFSIADSVVLDIGNGFVMDDYVLSKRL